MKELLNKLFSELSVSGSEKKICDLIESELKDYADEITRDPMGNLIVLKKGTSASPKKFMFAAHCDEIGFMVSFFDDKGYVRVSPVGGIFWKCAAFSHVIFENGVRGVVVPEEDVKPADYARDKFYIDIGAADKAEAESLVSMGMTCAVIPQLFELAHGRLAGRPFDDKIGCAILIEAAKRLTKTENDIYFVFTVQEEVGCRGAKTSAFAVRPDYAVAIDVCDTGDMIGSKSIPMKLGAGAAIKLKDASVICDPRMIALMRNISDAASIPYHYEVTEYGGTDTCWLQMSCSGSIAGALSIPTRYIHSGVEMIDTADAEACVRLVVGLCEAQL